jgi:hypothetical protein
METPVVVKPYVRSYRLATIGDFQTWHGDRNRQNAHIRTKRPWFPPALQVVGGRTPVWHARTAALAHLNHGFDLPGLPEAVRELLDGDDYDVPALCGNLEIGEWLGYARGSVTYLTQLEWFILPYDTVSAKSSIPAYVEADAIAVLMEHGKLSDEAIETLKAQGKLPKD